MKKLTSILIEFMYLGTAFVVEFNGVLIQIGYTPEKTLMETT